MGLQLLRLLVSPCFGMSVTLFFSMVKAVVDNLKKEQAGNTAEFSLEFICPSIQPVYFPSSALFIW